MKWMKEREIWQKDCQSLSKTEKHTQFVCSVLVFISSHGSSEQDAFDTSKASDGWESSEVIYTTEQLSRNWFKTPRVSSWDCRTHRKTPSVYFRRHDVHCGTHAAFCLSLAQLHIVQWLTICAPCTIWTRETRLSSLSQLPLRIVPRWLCAVISVSSHGQLQVTAMP